MENEHAVNGETNNTNINIEHGTRSAFNPSSATERFQELKSRDQLSGYYNPEFCNQIRANR